MKNLLFRTAPGLEKLVKGEILQHLRGTGPAMETIKAANGKGWVRVSLPDICSTHDIVAGIPTAFRILADCTIGARGESNPVTAAENMVRKCRLEELTSGLPFRVTCYAGDEPSGTTRAVEQALGRKIVDKTGAPVSLTEYSINYGIEFTDRHMFFGAVLKDEEDIPRYRKKFQVRSSVRAHIAAGMLRLCGFTENPGVMLDPCCGSGTILLEAAATAPGVRLYGVDTDPKCVEGARQNLDFQRKAGEGTRIRQGDARQLHELFPAGSVNYLVSNLPFGIRTGRKINFYSFYRDILKGADSILSRKGRAALMIGRQRGILTRAVEEEGQFRIFKRQVLEVSGLHPAIYILQRKEM